MLSFISSIRPEPRRSRLTLLSLRQLCGALFLFPALVCAASTPADAIRALPPGHWYEIPDSRLDSVDPCPPRNCAYSAVEGQSAVMNDWNGGAFDSNNNQLIVWGGGHQGYAGNEVYALDLSSNQGWQRLSEPSSDVDCDQTTGLYPDGTPCAAHTYDYVDFHPPSNSFIKLGSTSNYPDGGAGVGKVNLFDLASKQWRNGATLALGAGALTGASSAYDPKRDVYWLLPAYDQKLAKYEPNANQGAGKWTSYNNYNIDIDAVSAIDPERNWLVTLNGRVLHQVIVHKLDQPDKGGKVVKTSGDKTLEGIKATGFEWNPQISKFVGWGGGSSVYTLDPENWQWQEISAAADNTVNPSEPNANGTYSRFRYMPALDAFIVVNRVTDNVYAYKLGEPTAANDEVSADPDPEPLAAASVASELSDSDSSYPTDEAVAVKTPAQAAGKNVLIDNEPPVFTPLPADPEENFRARASAPGVVSVEAFDDEAAILAKDYPDALGSFEHVLFDSGQKASGMGALEFIIPSNSPANSSGSWRTNFSADGSVRFGAGETFYVQWRQRFDAAMLGTLYQTTDGSDGSWKTAIIGQGDAPGFAYDQAGETGSCTALEVVVQNTYQRYFPQLYHNCGVYGPLAPSFANEQGVFYNLQNGIDRGENVTPIQDRFVLYSFEANGVTQLREGSPAVSYFPDEWMTFQLRISPGPLGKGMDFLSTSEASGFTNSTVEMWVAREGQPSVKTHSLSGLVLRRNDGAKDSDEKYGKIWFTPYQTNKNPDQQHPVGHTWVDELIVSRNRIQDP